MRKNLVIIFVLAIVGFGIILFALGRSTLPGAPEPTSTTVARIGGADITLEYAITPAERMRGLSGRRILPDQTGVLFIFPYSDKYNFWMKDMYFPIDIIWIGENRRVVGIEHFVDPDTYPATFSPPVAVPYVLEVNGGFADLYDIKVGDELIISGGWPY